MCVCGGEAVLLRGRRALLLKGRAAQGQLPVERRVAGGVLKGFQMSILTASPILKLENNLLPWLSLILPYTLEPTTTPPHHHLKSQVRYDRRVGDASAIQFLTDGVLLRQLQSDFLLTRYSVLLVDEAHERSLNTDLLLGECLPG